MEGDKLLQFKHGYNYFGCCQPLERLSIETKPIAMKNRNILRQVRNRREIMHGRKGSLKVES